MLLETGRKVILVIKWQKNLAELCPYVLWQVETISDKQRYLTEAMC
jgi:hypothetical protein